jgi:predicted nucleic acid-binding protein
MCIGKNGLLAGDALLLALALRVDVAAFFTLDVRLAENAKCIELQPVGFK